MDYNIYIHGDNTSQDKNAPWSPTETTESSGFKGVSASDVNRAIGYAQNPDSIISTASSKIMKALPWVAVAYAVLKLTDKAITTVNSFYTTETGDYRFSTQFNNFKAGLKAVFTPVSTTINYLKAQQETRISNEKKGLERELLGDNLLNGGSFYGV